MYKSQTPPPSSLKPKEGEQTENQLKAATDLLIAALKSKANEVSEGYVYDEYKLDDGQMKIEVKYQSISDVLNLANDIDKTNVEKVSCLRQLLETITIDKEKSIMGSEPFLKPVFDSVESATIKSKIFELISKF